MRQSTPKHESKAIYGFITIIPPPQDAFRLSSNKSLQPMIWKNTRSPYWSCKFGQKTPMHPSLSKRQKYDEEIMDVGAVMRIKSSQIRRCRWNHRARTRHSHAQLLPLCLEAINNNHNPKKPQEVPHSLPLLTSMRSIDDVPHRCFFLALNQLSTQCPTFLL